jgi:hypothetical protein
MCSYLHKKFYFCKKWVLHTRNWVLGWSRRTEDGQLVPKSSELSEVLWRVKNLVVLQKEDKFKANHQNDQLTAAL